MDETVKLKEPQTTALAIVEAEELKALVTSAFRSMATTMLGMRVEQETQRKMLTQIIQERDQLVDLAQRLSDQVVALTKLQDSDHAAIEVLLASRENGLGPRHVH